jgi:hypothetical protein
MKGQEEEKPRGHRQRCLGPQKNQYESLAHSCARVFAGENYFVCNYCLLPSSAKNSTTIVIVGFKNHS